jgi:hypothetical protein
MSCERQVARVLTCRIVLVLLIVAAGSHRSEAAKSDQHARELGRIQAEQLDEVSGMAASRQQPDILWMHNDGDSKDVYAVRPTGQLVAQVRILAETRDVEDIAIGPGPQKGRDYLYLGDIGDNDDSRSEICVLRFAEPILQPAREVRFTAADVDELRLTYPDGPHNAEALMVDPATGDLVIVTKEKKRARVYVARAGRLRDKSVVALEKVADIKNCRHVSGGDISQDGSLIVLRRESRGWLWLRRDGETIGDALRRPAREIPIKSAGQGLNGESIALRGDRRGYYTVSEGAHESICLFSLDRVLAELKAAR